MGLFSILFGKSGEREYPLQSKPTLKPLLLSGCEERKVYVYDGSPLKSIKKHERIVLHATADEITMISAETGGVWSTSDEDSSACALLYNGKPIGFMSSYGGILQELCKRGFDVQIDAMRTGSYSPIIPEIKAYMPSYQEVKGLLDSRQKAMNEGRLVKFNIKESAFKQEFDVANKQFVRSEGAPDFVVGSISISGDTRMIEVPKGSRAKPHILLLDKEIPVTEIAATCGAYSTMTDKVGQLPSSATISKIPSMRDRREFYYAIELTY